MSACLLVAAALAGCWLAQDAPAGAPSRNAWATAWASPAVAWNGADRGTDPGAASVVDRAAGARPPGRPDVAGPARDRWFAEDKLRHLAMAFAATTFGYGGARAVFDPAPATVAATLATSVLAVGKEIHDHHEGSGVSPGDLVWDAAGMALGLVLVRRIR